MEQRPTVVSTLMTFVLDLQTLPEGLQQLQTPSILVLLRGGNCSPHQVQAPPYADEPPVRILLPPDVGKHVRDARTGAVFSLPAPCVSQSAALPVDVVQTFVCRVHRGRTSTFLPCLRA